MTSLDDVRRQHPVTDRDGYDRAYAEADLASRMAEIVYRLRTGAGLTQTELARRMGTTQSSIARVEGGGSLPTFDLLDRVGRALDVQITLTVSGETIHFGSTAHSSLTDPPDYGRPMPEPLPRPSDDP
jgi:transcriptional regulator with XRE-family HTH domain